MMKLPGEIERQSMAIIREELAARNLQIDADREAVVLRCIHASADFDYAETLRFTPQATAHAIRALQQGTGIITDTNMALAGISKPGLNRLGGWAKCFMADEEIANAAKANGTTRAVAAMEYAAKQSHDAIFAIGNAPTALLCLAEQLENGLRPSLIIAAPVGFVNVTEAKERIFDACVKTGIPCIAAMGRKGGSSIAAAICNALIYAAADLADPAARGWS